MPNTESKYVYIFPPKGLYYEMFQPNPNSLNESLNVNNNKIYANGYFWNEIFNKDNVLELIEKLKLYSISKTNINPKFLAILENPNKFYIRIMDALIKICDQGNTEQEFFKYLETLNIYVELYNLFNRYSNCFLSIQEGFVLPEYSYEIMNIECLDLSKNPYLQIVAEKIIPVIEEYSPDVVFFVGKPSYFFAAISKILKQKNGKIKICYTQHSSEYYSLNKIKDCLKKNDLLFKDIDIIILEYYEDTEKRIINNDLLKDIPNIIYKNKHGETIINKSEIPLNSNCISYKKAYSNTSFKVNPNEMMDVHLTPYSKCFWNKCTFCGINKKYSHDYCENDLYRFKNNAELLEKDISLVKYVWFIDEAFTIKQLEYLSDYLLKEKINILWQARTRIDIDLVKNDLPNRLYRAGLRELRLGLESASLKILKLMNKFDEDFELGIVRTIINEYTAAGISLHFPIIVGFPGETKKDRNQTYKFLKEISNNRMVTFNINIFNLDVSSSVFKNWLKFDIESISLPCRPQYFLDNIAQWNGTIVDYKVLDNERNSFMRKYLYNWMPSNTITKPAIMYRLYESIRNTLINKATNNTYIYSNNLQNDLSITKIDKEFSLVYNWENHHYLKCSNDILEIIKKHETIENKEELISELKIENAEYIIDKLIKYGFLIDN